MKKIYLAFCLLVSTIAFAQPRIRVYAFAQETTPGTIPVDEYGNPRKMEPNINYLLYAEYQGSYAIKFDGVWIKGKGYSAQSSVVTSTPVTITNYDIPSKPVTIVLVPATKQKVMELQPIGRASINVNAAWFRDMLRKNELIISYYYKGKKYFIPVRKLNWLPPVSAM